VGGPLWGNLLAESRDGHKPGGAELHHGRYRDKEGSMVQGRGVG